MSIDNIALVRATNVIPFDGVVRPISNTRYLSKNVGLEFSARLSDLLHSEAIIPPIDSSRMFEEDYYDRMVALSSKILKEYLPYVSDYNSMVLFSLNGICPDDRENGVGNNTFSDKKVAIIEPLVDHIDQAISLVPTDTAIKGDVVLSSNAVVIIEEGLFQSLSAEEKIRLNSNKFIVKTFKGTIKEAIREELQNSKRYSSETLSLSSRTGGVMPSDTSDEFKSLLEQVANKLGLSQLKHYNMITSTDKTIPKYSEVSNEFDNINIVQEYYMSMFLSELLEIIKAPDYMKANISKKLYNKSYMLKLMDLIKEFGIDNYKKLVDDYNFQMEQKQKDGTLLTPQDVVNKSHQKGLGQI